MKHNGKTIWAIAAANFNQLVPAYIVTAAFFLVGVYNLIACLMGWSDNFYVDMANYFYVLAVMAPILIVSRNFKKIMYLNGNKQSFYFAALLGYAIVAAIASFLCIAFYVITDAVFGSQLIIQSLVVIFGWWNHGIILAFIQQLVFLFLIEVFVHTLVSIQTCWYGWITDVVLVLILFTFIPIPELRRLLADFFNMIIFNNNVMIQIISCLLLAAILYLLYLPILQKKKV